MRVNLRPRVMFFSNSGDSVLELIDKTKTTPDLIVTQERLEGDEFNKDLLGITNTQLPRL
jgi:hypothetical protein